MATPHALRLYAGPKALAQLREQGLRAQDVAVIPGAAGGPKGLVLGPLDEFIFGRWLPQSRQTVHLVGASIGAWRMATACLPDPLARFQQLSHDYIHQTYEVEPGRRMPTADQVSETFGRNLRDFYDGAIGQLLSHPRYRLHVVVTRGRHLLRREHPVLTPLGYLGAFVSNAVHRRALGAWFERVVFSSGEVAPPFTTGDLRTRLARLTPHNFHAAVQASCSIPFALRAVQDIPGLPPGAYWDGGITDYHLHLDYRPVTGQGGLVLYPHFQRAVVPGWLDKALRWRHGATPALDHTLVLAPDPQWVARLPHGKLPDRTDFTRYGNDVAARAKVWQAAVSASRQLADEFEAWLAKPDPSRIELL